MYKVLIVDDVEILRRDIRRLKAWGEASGFLIQDEAKDGQEALQKLRSNPCDVVITDIKMPVLDGMGLLRTVSKERLCPCVVLLSDYKEFEYAREGLVYGAFDYLGKPVDNNKLTELLGRIKEFLDARKREQDKQRLLEGIVEEAFYPLHNVEELSRLLINADAGCISKAVELTETIGAAFGFDRSKSAIVLRNAIHDVLSRVLAEHGWIHMYSNPGRLKTMEFESCEDWECVKDRIRQMAETVYSFLARFIVWRGQNTVREACLQVLCHVEENISVKSVSEKLFISKAYLSELFKQSTGLSLLEYINRVKMERAKFLLETGSYKNYEIADRLGFNDHEYFSKIFKRHAGCPPNAYRKERKEQPP